MPKGKECILMGISPHLTGKVFLSWDNARLVCPTSSDILIWGDSHLCWTSGVLRTLD